MPRHCFFCKRSVADLSESAVAFMEVYDDEDPEFDAAIVCMECAGTIVESRVKEQRYGKELQVLTPQTPPQLVEAQEIEIDLEKNCEGCIYYMEIRRPECGFPERAVTDTWPWRTCDDFKPNLKWLTARK